MSYNNEQQSIRQICKDYAEGTRRTVFFVGAGGSAEVGMPTWAALRSSLLQRISNDIDSINNDENELENFRELEELASDSDKFWEFFSHAASKWPTSYGDHMTQMFDHVVEKASIPVLYKRLWSMRRVRQVFTLNVDGLLARAFGEEFPRSC